jgi:hypothetical protein
MRYKERVTEELSAEDIADSLAELGFDEAAELVMEWKVDGALISELNVAGWERMFEDLGIDAPEDRNDIAAWLNEPPPVQIEEEVEDEEDLATFGNLMAATTSSAVDDGSWAAGKQFTAAKKIETRAGPEEFTTKVDTIKKGEILQILEVRQTTMDASAAAIAGGAPASITTVGAITVGGLSGAGVRDADALLARCAKGWFGPVLLSQCNATLTPVRRRAATTGEAVKFTQPQQRWLNDTKMHSYSPNGKELVVCFVVEDAKEKGLWHLQIRGRTEPNSPAMSEPGKWSPPIGTVLTARKQTYSREPHVSISTGVTKSHHQRMSEHYAGKLRKDPAGKKTHIWDAGNSPDTKESDSKWVKDKLPNGEEVSRPLRKELMCILQSTKSNRDSNRRLVVLVPHENAILTPASKAERKAGRGELRLVDLYKTVGRDTMNSTHTLDSIHPGPVEVEDGNDTNAGKGKGKDKKGKNKEDKVDKEAVAQQEPLEFFDVGGVLVPIQKSSVNFQLGLYPGGELVCQLSKRPMVRCAALLHRTRALRALLRAELRGTALLSPLLASFRMVCMLVLTYRCNTLHPTCAAPQEEGSETAYRLAFTAPLTAFTAFCVALSQLTHK